MVEGQSALELSHSFDLVYVVEVVVAVAEHYLIFGNYALGIIRLTAFRVGTVTHKSQMLHWLLEKGRIQLSEIEVQLVLE